MNNKDNQIITVVGKGSLTLGPRQFKRGDQLEESTVQINFGIGIH